MKRHGANLLLLGLLAMLAACGGSNDDDTSSPAVLRATFLGNANVLLDDGESRVLIDGFFTRPSMADFGAMQPDPQIVRATLQRAGIETLDAVLVSHSHYDHVMDAPEVCLQTGAQLVGSESTANVGRGWGLDESRITVVEPETPMTFGHFQVTFVPSIHSVPDVAPGTIDEPLVPPVSANDYKEGGSFSILVEHELGSVLSQGSANFIPGALDDYRADTAFLGIASAGSPDDAFFLEYWRQVVVAAGVTRVFPVHWDNFFISIDEAMAAPLPEGHRHTVELWQTAAAESGNEVVIPDIFGVYTLGEAGE